MNKAINLLTVLVTYTSICIAKNDSTYNNSLYRQNIILGVSVAYFVDKSGYNLTNWQFGQTSLLTGLCNLAVSYKRKVNELEYFNVKLYGYRCLTYSENSFIEDFRSIGTISYGRTISFSRLDLYRLKTYCSLDASCCLGQKSIYSHSQQYIGYIIPGVGASLGADFAISKRLTIGTSVSYNYFYTQKKENYLYNAYRPESNMLVNQLYIGWLF